MSKFRPHQFKLKLRISTVSKRSLISAHDAETEVSCVDDEIDKDDDELKLMLAEHFQTKLKHTIFMVEILEAEKIEA